MVTKAWLHISSQRIENTTVNTYLSQPYHRCSLDTIMCSDRMVWPGSGTSI